VIGRRQDCAPHQLQPGEFCFYAGVWYAHCPGPGKLIANLGAHQVTEEADGTITVSPSILCSGGGSGLKWHGFLERGVWREC